MRELLDWLHGRLDYIPLLIHKLEVKGFDDKDIEDIIKCMDEVYYGLEHRDEHN